MSQRGLQTLSETERLPKWPQCDRSSQSDRLVENMAESHVPVTCARKYWVYTGHSHVWEKLQTNVDLPPGTPSGTDLPTIPGFKYLRDIQQSLVEAHHFCRQHQEQQNGPMTHIVPSLLERSCGSITQPGRRVSPQNS